MLPAHIALVPEAADTVSSTELSRISAALQKQVTRDFGPRWGIDATVDSFRRLEDVPLGYWPVIVTARAMGDDEGFHKTIHGEPYSIIERGTGWSVTASHEILEMLVDPSGNRTVPGTAPDGVTRVEYLMEVCDPCQSAACTYSVNDVLVSDFVLPEYFSPEPGTAASYTFAQHIASPHSLAEGGSITWIDRLLGKVVHARCINGVVETQEFPLDETDFRPLRARVHAVAKDRRPLARLSGIEQALKVGEKRGASAAAMRSRAELLRRELGKLGTTQAKRIAEPNNVAIKARLATLLQKPDALGPELTAFLARARDELLKGDPDLSHQWELAVVKGAFRSPLRSVVLTERDVPGLDQYDGEDVRWAKALWEYVTTKKTPFIECPEAAWKTLITPIADTASIAIAGDWGTHNDSSKNIGNAMLARSPMYTIHLGDVYYAGTTEEEAQFIDDWPTGSVGTFILNSNHEMYSGGNPFFHDALQSDRLGTQTFSYFALSSPSWLIVGLDSAYNATVDNAVQPYDVGHLPAADPQVRWLRWLLSSPEALRADGTKKKLCILTHHEGGFDMKGDKTALMNEMVEAAGRAPDLWYWGHTHGAAVFDTIPLDGVNFRGRLLGHGGIPYIPDFAPEDDAKNHVTWAERDPSNMKAVGKNGFAMLQLKPGGGIDEEYFDEKGESRWKGSL